MSQTAWLHQLDIKGRLGEQILFLKNVNYNITEI